MKKVILAAVYGLFAANLYATEKLDFSADSFVKQLGAIPAAAMAAPAAVTADAPTPAKGGQYVQVSGYVNLNGNAYMPANGGFTSVTLNGWATFRDATGQVTSNNTYINSYVSMWIYPNQHVFQMVNPNVFVQFYKNGKPVGSTYMTGSVSVSGWPGATGFVMLSGTGYLNGSIYVQDAE